MHCKALPFCCASTVYILSKTVPYRAAHLSRHIQMFSMVLSSFAFGHVMAGPAAYLGVTVVFGTIWFRFRRRYLKS
eukprot:SAG22_NODE_3101_length_1940_cov_1.023900_3_plen_76_part_00